MNTKPLSYKEYPTHILTTDDMVKYFANKEATAMSAVVPAKLLPDTRPHKAQWSETTKRAFNTDIIKFLLP